MNKNKGKDRINKKWLKAKQKQYPTNPKAKLYGKMKSMQSEIYHLPIRMLN